MRNGSFPSYVESWGVRMYPYVDCTWGPDVCYTTVPPEEWSVREKAKRTLVQD